MIRISGQHDRPDRDGLAIETFPGGGGKNLEIGDGGFEEVVGGGTDIAAVRADLLKKFMDFGPD